MHLKGLIGQIRLFTDYPLEERLEAEPSGPLGAYLASCKQCHIVLYLLGRSGRIS